MEIELPSATYIQLMNFANDLKRTPDLLITEALMDKFGLVGKPLDDKVIWGKPKS